MLNLAVSGSVEDCCKLARQQIANGEGLAKLAQMVKAQAAPTSPPLAPPSCAIPPRHCGRDQRIYFNER